MRLSDKHIETLEFVARFELVTPAHVRQTVFANYKSATSTDRVLAKLKEQKYLDRVEFRTVGGSNGGSACYAWFLGYQAWKRVGRTKSYHPRTSIDYHKIDIVNAYASLYSSQSDTFRIVHFETEPDCHVKIGFISINPDLYLVVEKNGATYPLWLEIDEGTESANVIREKMDRYYKAYLGASKTRWEDWPIIIWVPRTEKRANMFRTLVQQLPIDQRDMYRVTTLDGLSSLIAS